MKNRTFPPFSYDRRWILRILPLVFLVTACVKEPIPMLNPHVADGVAGLKVPSSFQWTMIRSLHLRITGNEAATTINNTLTIADDGGNIYLKRKTRLDENLELSLSVPSVASQLTLTYGTIVKTVDISAIGDTLQIDYLFPVVEADLVDSEDPSQ